MTGFKVKKVPAYQLAVERGAFEVEIRHDSVPVMVKFPGIEEKGSEPRMRAVVDEKEVALNGIATARAFNQVVGEFLNGEPRFLNKNFKNQ